MGREDMSPEEIDEAADHGLVRACVQPDLPEHDPACSIAGCLPSCPRRNAKRWATCPKEEPC